MPLPLLSSLRLLAFSFSFLFTTFLSLELNHRTKPARPLTYTGGDHAASCGAVRGRVRVYPQRAGEGLAVAAVRARPGT